MSTAGRVRMADVARAAGVSVATVSKVVNGRYGVSQETAERVSAVVDDHGYATSLGARSLRSHQTNVIGVLVAEFEPFSTELLKGRRPSARPTTTCSRSPAGTAATPWAGSGVPWPGSAARSSTAPSS